MAAKTIMIKGDSVQQRIERVAGGAITSGHLLELNSSDKLIVHNSTGQNVAPTIFAIEDDLQGNKISEAYSSGDLVQAVIARPGDEIYALLADGETAVIGSLLESAGDGTLQVHTPDTWSEAIGVDSAGNLGSGTIYTRQIVGTAAEALDMSDSSAADPSSNRLKVIIA